MVSEPAQNDSSSEPLKAMAGVPDSTSVPLPEDENDFDLFGPPDAAGAAGASQPQQPVPPGPAQQPAAAPAVQQVTVGLDPAMANDAANDAESADYAGNAEQAHGR